ncbi:hypothetical protein scyTo_0001837 [Scyliorhinus torazame]|uniref:Uncharacterized protein n=1 Tax=Scyliorhinus torazame TaxID=75743 RepID=A0A401PG57_SCYTO|nr:hypothetical protein [Scyliorhinus torazame]
MVGNEQFSNRFFINVMLQSCEWNCTSPAKQGIRTERMSFRQRVSLGCSIIIIWKSNHHGFHLLQASV